MIKNDCPNSITGVHVSQPGYENGCKTCEIINVSLSHYIIRMFKSKLRAARGE